MLRSRRVLISVLGIAIILSYLYVPLNSTAQSSNLESSGISEMPLLAAEASSGMQSSSSNIIKEVGEGQSSHREILSSNSNATNEAKDIEQCDDLAVLQEMEESIGPYSDSATLSSELKAYENVDLGVRFMHLPSWNKVEEGESDVSFQGTIGDNVISVFHISRLDISMLDGAAAPLQYINEVNYEYKQSGYNTNNQSRYNTTQPTSLTDWNKGRDHRDQILISPGLSGYLFNYSYIDDTDSLSYGYELVVVQNNTSYRIMYIIKPKDYDLYHNQFQGVSVSGQYKAKLEEYDSYFEEFYRTLDSLQIFDVKRYEKLFYNNSTGVILRYPSLVQNFFFFEDLRPNEISNTKINFTKNDPWYGNAVFNLELSIFPYKPLDEFVYDLKYNLKNNKTDHSDVNICKTEIPDNLGQNNATAHKLHFTYNSSENQHREGLLLYAIYNDTYSYLFNFTAEAYDYDQLLPTVEEIYDSLKIFAPITYTKDEPKPSGHPLFSEIEYPKGWTLNSTRGGFGFQILSSLEDNSTDSFIEHLFVWVSSSPAATSRMEQHVSSQIDSLKKNLTNFQIVDSRESTVLNNHAHKIVFTYRNDKDDGFGEIYDQEGNLVRSACYCDVKEVMIFTMRDEKLYGFSYAAELDKFSSYLPIIENILYSIQIEDKPLGDNPIRSGLPLNGGPIDLAVNPISNMLYVAIPEARQIQVIDGSTDQVVQNITIDGKPNAVTLNPYLNKIYVASPETDMVYVIDGLTNNITAKIQAGPMVADMAVDTNEFGGYRTLIFVANQGNGSISIIDDIKGKIVSNIKTGPNPWGVGIDPMKNRAYITNDFGVDVIDYTASLVEHKVFGVVYENIYAGYLPTGIAIDSNRSRAYITNLASNTVSVIDTSSNRELYQITVGPFPNSIAFNPSNKKLYVSNTGNNSFSIIDTASDDKVETRPSGSVSYDVSFNPNTNIIYLANFESKTLATMHGDSNAAISALTFYIDPPDAGKIECYGNNSTKKEISENSYQRITNGDECKAVPNSGFVFSYWCNGAPSHDLTDTTCSSDSSSFWVSQYGIYTAKFSSPSDILHDASPIISVGGLVSVILLATMTSTFHIREKPNKEREEKSDKNVEGMPISEGVYRIGKVENDEKENHKQKDEGEEDSKLSKVDIITIDAGIIGAVLVLVTLAEGFEIAELTQITVITATIIIPFAISAIIGLTERRELATRLMIAGFINVMISIIILAIMKF